MPTPLSLLAISSSVAAGHVGLSAIVPTLNFCRLEVIALPTIILSNHPGLPHCSGTAMDPEILAAMLEKLDAGGMLETVRTVLSGYLPSPAHVALVEAAIDRVRRHHPSVRYICDPVLGDDPKGVYIPQETAAAIRDRLVPSADILLPNRFELEWLSGEKIDGPAAAIAAAQSLPVPRVIAKSVPLSDDTLAVIDAGPTTRQTISVSRAQHVPNGTGDMFSALIAAGLPVAQAVASLQIAIEQSLGQDHLQIVASSPAWTRAAFTASAANQPPPWSTATSYVAGVDGCPAGWIAVVHPEGEPHRASCQVYESFQQLLADLAGAAAIAVDIPIGLLERATTGGRQADRDARSVLGARQSSVFAVPARAAVFCDDYGDACAAALAHSDPPRKVAKQTFYLFPKIREVDTLMTPQLQKTVVECHPEVAFWAMNNEKPLDEPKKRKSRPYPAGLELRRRLLAAQGFTPEFLAGPDCPRRLAAPDDFLDACAAAWTAGRLAAGKARRMPAAPPSDTRGLRMEIVY